MCVLFKQKPAYEMRISDWSSDVCSSDLPRVDARAGEIEPLGAAEARADDGAVFAQTKGEAAAGGPRFFGGDRRAEERVIRIEIVDPRRGDQVDRKSVVEGQSVAVRVDLGGRCIMQKNKYQVEDDDSQLV